jgi:predicted alpha/beta superfamily hydrolase
MITLPHTEIIDLKSNYNEAEYSLFIRLPNEYKTNNKHYPTLFLLDPQYLFSVCYGVRKIYENYIIIGIGHKDLDFQELDNKACNHKIEINRDRDFLPWKLDKKTFVDGVSETEIDEIVNASGQAEKFSQFINHQVIPLVDKSFRTTEDRTLIGHSFGGVFVSFMLFCHPENFAKYIAITPVLASEYYQEKKMFGALKRKTSDTKKFAYFSIGGEETDDRMNSYVEVLKKACLEIAKISNVVGKVEIISEENHVSVVTPSIWRGLKFFDENLV